jgi:hypothetical protein
MTRIAPLLTLLATALVFLLPAAPALAQRDRVFVASYGSDSNPCTFGSPCKTFQQAINSVAVGGEVTAIDSAGFGSVTISHAVTITSPNGVEAGIAAPASGGAAITIAVTSGVVSLNGLTLDGDNVTNTTGIEFTGAATLHIQNCVIRNFGGSGVEFEPSASSQLTVSNTVVSDNDAVGIWILSAPTLGVLDHVVMQNNGSHGLFVSSELAAMRVTVTDSVSANGGGNGIYAESQGGSSSPINILVRNSTIINNAADGLLAQGTDASIDVMRSTIAGNATGWAETSSGTVTSFGNNNIIGNTAGNTPGPTKTALE